MGSSPHTRDKFQDKSMLYTSGSSPHTRDKSPDTIVHSNSVRIIPAYAGQMISPSANMQTPRDHPRIRGTNPHKALRYPNQVGSSPHTRDKFEWVPGERVEFGIIPAYAGQI